MLNSTCQKATRSKSAGELDSLCLPSKEPLKDAPANADAESQTDAGLEQLLD